MYAGSGLIIAAVIQAENPILSLIFFAAGELCLVIYCFMYQKVTKFDDREVRSRRVVCRVGSNVDAGGTFRSASRRS